MQSNPSTVHVTSAYKNTTGQYTPGKEMVLADSLSRFPSHKENLPTDLHQHIIKKSTFQTEDCTSYEDR